MRTTVTIEDDVLTAAKAVAEARGISLGRALSELARRGLASAPVRQVNGFVVFDVPDAPAFGLDEVQAAEDADDVAQYARFFPR